AGAGTTLVSLGATLQLQARPVDASGKPVDRTGILTWSSSDPAVASVDAGGLLTARSNGTCSVSASLGTLAGALQITVAQAPGQLT
ncbi:Ig-like domain-containing protein, partial [Enterococcus casseliflavus]|uniref:Ig-like domain-containing protein n=1 Tax=Enterococcus casseliflavus TaxID=37734 RepID=UPI003D105722